MSASPERQKADMSVALLNVRFWPKPDMPKNAIDVAIGGKADMPFCTACIYF